MWGTVWAGAAVLIAIIIALVQWLFPLPPLSSITLKQSMPAIIMVPFTLLIVLTIVVPLFTGNPSVSLPSSVETVTPKITPSISSSAPSPIASLTPSMSPPPFTSALASAKDVPIDCVSYQENNNYDHGDSCSPTFPLHLMLNSIDVHQQPTHWSFTAHLDTSGTNCQNMFFLSIELSDETGQIYPVGGAYKTRWGLGPSQLYKFDLTFALSSQSSKTYFFRATIQTCYSVTYYQKNFPLGSTSPLLSTAMPQTVTSTVRANELGSINNVLIDCASYNENDGHDSGNGCSPTLPLHLTLASVNLHQHPTPWYFRLSFETNGTASLCQTILFQSAELSDTSTGQLYSGEGKRGTWTLGPGQSLLTSLTFPISFQSGKVYDLNINIQTCYSVTTYQTFSFLS